MELEQKEQQKQHNIINKLKIAYRQYHKNIAQVLCIRKITYVSLHSHVLLFFCSLCFIHSIVYCLVLACITYEKKVQKNAHDYYAVNCVNKIALYALCCAEKYCKQIVTEAKQVYIDIIFEHNGVLKVYVLFLHKKCRIHVVIVLKCVI